MADRDQEHKSAIDLAREALEHAERSYAEGETNSAELLALAASDRKRQALANQILGTDDEGSDS